MKLEARTALPSVVDDFERETSLLSQFSGGSHADVRIGFPVMESAIKKDSPRYILGMQPRLAAGAHHETPFDLRGNIASNLNWQETRDGRVVATVSVHSPEEEAFRAQLGIALSSGATIRYFELSEDGGSELLYEQSVEGSRTAAVRAVSLWSPTIQSGRLGIEVDLPAPEASADFALEVPRISVQNQSADIQGAVSPLNFAFSSGCENQVDAKCSSDSSLRGKVASVGRILVEKNGEPMFCTGTLINSRNPLIDALSLGDGTAPYLLTSNSCVATQQEADSMEVTWFYENSTCGSERLDHRVATTFGGGELLATSIDQDSSLIRLRQGLPGGLIYSGWRASPLSVPSNVGTIHHPRGAAKKAATGQALRRAGQGQLRDGIEVQWRVGATEQGSQGAGLYSGGYLVGVLSQTSQSCESGTSQFGAFEAFFPQIQGYLLGDHGNTSETATTIAVPSSIQAALSAGDSDFFRIQITEANRLVVYSEGDTNTQASLTRDGAGVAQADGGALGQNFLIEADVTPGSYLLEVSGASDAVSGNYTLRTGLERVGRPTAAPSNVRAERGVRQIDVSWGLVPRAQNEGSPIAGYVAVASGANGSVQSCESPPHVGSCAIFGVQDDLQYRVVVRATNALGQGPDSSSAIASPLVTGERQVPPALENVRVFLDQSNSTLTVSWRSLPAALRTDDLTYKVDAASSLGDLSCEAASNRLSCEISVPASSDGGVYSVTAYAQNALGPGPRSAPVSVTPLHETDHSDVFSTAGVVGTSSITAGSISRSGDVDWFRVDVLDAGTLYVWTEGDTDTSAPKLRTAEGDRDWDGGGGNSGQGSNFWHYENLTSGTYYFSVEGYYSTSTGDYTLHVDFVKDDHGNRYQDASVVALKSETPSHLAHGEVDWFKVDVLDAGTLYVWTEGDTDTITRQLRTAEGDRDWDGGGGNSGQGSNFWHYENLTSGTYYFSVEGYYSTSTGDYTLHVDFVACEIDNLSSRQRCVRVQSASTPQQDERPVTNSVTSDHSIHFQ
ncbi:MAG: fibronectin type III domain-containing protein [Gammaproteobacteria bacterium]|nr:fibronectin type III domain-containing protein [Gammaproteobacteria bacterium]